MVWFGILMNVVLTLVFVVSTEGMWLILVPDMWNFWFTCWLLSKVLRVFWSILESISIISGLLWIREWSYWFFIWSLLRESGSRWRSLRIWWLVEKGWTISHLGPHGASLSVTAIVMMFVFVMLSMMILIHMSLFFTVALVESSLLIKTMVVLKIVVVELV